jgi:hypothetical protein
MNEVEHIEGWQGQAVIDPSGAELGKIDEVYFDPASGSALLIAVKSGLLGRHAALIPLAGATFGRDYVRVVHSQATVDSANSGYGGGTPSRGELAAVGGAYGFTFSDPLDLETASEREDRDEEAEAARQRAAELAATAQEKLEQRDAAGEQAMDAKARADQAQAEAEEARRAALDAREHAQRYDER